MTALVRDCLIMAIELCDGGELALNLWWKQHQRALKLLGADDLAAVVAAKDRAKARPAAVLDGGVPLVADEPELVEDGE